MSFDTIPDFLTEALMGLDITQRPVSSVIWNERPDDCGRISCQTVQVEPPSLDKEATANAQIEVSFAPLCLSGDENSLWNGTRVRYRK